MPITAAAPVGGIVEQLGGESRPLILRNREIERFETQHNLGIFALLDQILGNGYPQARHCRDLVALGLVGGGLADRTADAIVSDLPPQENVRLRTVARDLLLAAFVPAGEGKKKVSLGGSAKKPPRKATTRAEGAKTQSASE